MKPKISALKRYARHLLSGKYQLMGTLYLLAFLIQTLVMMLPSVISGQDGLVSFCLQTAVSYLLNALVNLLLLGFTLAALHLAREQEVRLQDLFFPFRNQVDHFLALELILTGISMGITLPCYVLSYFYQMGQVDLVTYLAGYYLWYFAAIALELLVTVPFFLAPYLMLDQPSLTARAALKESIRRTRGIRGDILKLQFSFAGYYLLGIGSIIGFLWVAPYYETTLALYYTQCAFSQP